MWRNILTFADTSAAGLARVAIAERIADRHNAHLWVEILDKPPEAELEPEEVFFSGHTYGDVLEAVREVGRAEAAAVRSTLQRDPQFHIVSASPVHDARVRGFAAEAAYAADLVIVGKPDESSASRRGADALMGALIEGGAPVLALPGWIAPRRIGRRVLIAWRASPEAARAVRASLPFITGADTVRVCMANPHKRGEDASALARFEAYLLRHGAKLEATSAIESWEGPEPAFRAELEGYGADLLVMGGFHHAPLREVVFGGMTVAMLRDAPCAVMLAH